MPFLVKFWGTRGSIPTPGPSTRRYGGNTSCVEIRVDDTLIVCDSGTGIRELGVELKRRTEGPVEAHLFFSHMHWDHIQGFPFFLPAYEEQSTIKVYDVSVEESRFQQLLRGQMRSDYFPVEFRELGAAIDHESLEDGCLLLEGIRITSHEQTHPGRSWAYGFEKDGRRVVYATDHELDADLPDPQKVQEAPDEPRLVRPAFVEFIKDADLLIIDAQYTDDEYLAKVGWGHPRASTATDAAVTAKVKRMALYHHDPMHTDRDVEDLVEACQARAAAQGSEVEIFAAREGMELRVDR